MTEQTVYTLGVIAAIILGVMNWLKHRHMEQDLKHFPLNISLEISFAEDFEPQVIVKSVTRQKSPMFPSGIAEPGKVSLGGVH